MVHNIVEQVKPYVCDIIRICRGLDVKGEELYELNELVGQTSKLDKAI